jgi:uncharacterized protein YecE (DUF72 family)
MGEVRIGVSGWSYKSWAGSFFPKDVPKKRHLEYLGRRFRSLEVNGTFYSLQRPETFARWYDAVPAEFVYALKGSRFITHNKKMGDARTPLANYFASGLLRLDEKLGPIVWQLPTGLRFNEARLADFLQLLPSDTQAAAGLAHNHDSRLSGRSWMRPAKKRPLRHALEVRDESFFVPALVRLLRKHAVALVVSDSADWARKEEITAGFMYLRLHGARQTYASRYTDSELDFWAERIEKWRGGDEPSDAERITERKPPRRKSRDVFVFFDNDQQANAPRDALRLAERLGIATDFPH